MSPACLIKSPGNRETKQQQLLNSSSSSSNSQTNLALEAEQSNTTDSDNSDQQHNSTSNSTRDHKEQTADNMSLLVNNGSRENLKLSSSVNYSSQLDHKNAAVAEFHANECTRKLDQLIDISNSKSVGALTNHQTRLWLRIKRRIHSLLVLFIKKSTKKPWDILCQLINCKVAFKKQFNGKKYTWIQLAGHPGRFKPGDREGFILKLMDELERKSFEMLKSDILGPFVPAVDRVLYDMNDGNCRTRFNNDNCPDVSSNRECFSQDYTEMQDLLYSFNNPSIMDIKIGVRTFIIDESDEKETMPRHDLYLKMKKIAPNELTEEEHQRQAINKRRYMSWRECSTCSSTLGFRIEAIKVSPGSV